MGPSDMSHLPLFTRNRCRAIVVGILMALLGAFVMGIGVGLNIASHRAKKTPACLEADAGRKKET